MNWFKRRAQEPTSYIGLGLLVQSIMMLTKADPSHTELVSGSIQQAAEPLAAGDYTAAATIGLSGLLGLFMREKAN